MRRNFRECFAAFLILTFAVSVHAQFGVQIGQEQTFTDNRWPGAEDPTRVINWEGQKYLNFAGDEYNPDGSNVSSGFLVQPTLGDQAGDVPTSITFWAANDAVERDPAAFELWGINDFPELDRFDLEVTGVDAGQVFSLDLFTKISEGPLALPETRNDGGAADLDDANSQTIDFDNSAAFSNYMILFPELRDRDAQNSMQIAEVQLNYDGVDIANGIFDTDDAAVGLVYADLTPPPVYECITPAGDQPEPGQGFWSVREWLVPVGFPRADESLIANVDSVERALAVTATADVNCLESTADIPQIVYDVYAPTINHADPEGAGGGYSMAAAKQPFFSDQAGAQDDFIVRARGNIIIPEDGPYTFGVDGDDGFQLSIDGDVFLEAPGTTGNAFGVAGLDFIDLTAGEHEVELVWFERGGGAFVELFAAAGEKDELDGDFSPIGFAGFEGTAGTTPTVPAGWDVRVVDSVDGAALNNIAETEAALADGAEIDAGNFDVVDFPGESGIGGFGTDDFAVEATGKIVVEEDGDFIFGFNSDDGGQLCITGADFTVFNGDDNRTVSGDGECLDFNANTGNSNTYGTTFLAAGEYDARHIMWERGGGDKTAVYVSVGSDESGVAAVELLGVEANEIDTSIPAGLQLAGIEVVIDTCNPNTLGDIDGSGDVAFADFLILSQNFGQTATDHTTGDIDCSGDVAFADFLVLSQNFGQVVGAQAVPEPSSLALLGFAGLGLGFFRRRR